MLAAAIASANETRRISRNSPKPSNEQFLHIVEDEAPWIKYSVTVKPDLVVTFHFMKSLTTKLASILHVPPTAKSKRELDEFRDGVQKGDSQLESTTEKSEEMLKAISVLLDKLSDTTEERICTLQFIREQLKLLPMSKVRRRYSAEFMVFRYLFFTISPHAYIYKYVRECHLATPHDD
ncbi:hypothetical protein HPB49_022042 [Dermacentor silvarum]|uniref:Uncharacterized protein n=1 Tax=Dermacentor silvarum TaxID=543639 RepID=A0ACB8E3E8_DERSI|nr:hypothetical protein HPB49_022042 [Dermacentor silvarum]